MSNSCSSKFEAQVSVNGDNMNNNHFNVFANSFHVSDKARASMSLPKLTEDMVKLNQELHDISSQALVEDRQVLANQTPVQTHEALKV